MNQAQHDAAAYRQAADGSISGLHVALKARLAAIAPAFWTFSSKTTEPQTPQIVDFFLPPMATPDDKRFPFLIVRPKSGADSEQGALQNAKAVFEIVVGTWSDTDDGAFDVLQMIDAIRFDLGAAPVIDGTPYEQTGPLTWDLPDDNTRPQWLGRVTTNWTLPRPRRIEARNPGQEQS